jgi:hypothetical protein
MSPHSMNRFPWGWPTGWNIATVCAKGKVEEMTNVIAVFDELVGESLLVHKSRNGVYAACEAVWVRRRIVDIVGRLRVVGQLAPTSRWRGRAHATIFNARWAKA